MRVKLLCTAFSLVFYASFVHATPVLYTGELLVKKVSGKDCTGKEAGSTKSANLILDEKDGKITGYLWGDFSTGRFSGKDGNTLDLRYAFNNPLLGEGHSIILTRQGERLTAIVKERQLAADQEGCNWEDAELKLARSADDPAIAWKKAEARYTAHTYREQGIVLYNQEKYTEAIQLYEKALALREEADGKQAEPASWYLKSLVYAYANAGRLDDAQKLLDDGLKRFPSGESNKDLQETRDWLQAKQTEHADKLFYQAKALEDKRQYPQAIPLYLKALEIDRQIRPKYAAVGLLRIANCHKNMQQWQQAEQYYQESIALREKEYGPESKELGTSLSNLALLYYQMGQYSRAEPLYLRALAISEKTEGPEHASVATKLNNLAGLYETLGRYSMAEALYQRALAISEKANGPEHPSTEIYLGNLAGLYNSMGQYSRAEPLYLRALAISEKANGPEHPSTATTLNNLALLYETTGCYADAEPLYKRALAISEKTLGPEHLNTAGSLNNLAGLYYSTGRYIDVELLYKRALVIREKILGSEHLDVGQSLNNLAGLYREQQKYAEAAPLYQRALAIARNAGSPELTHNVQTSYSFLLEKQHNPEAAIFFGKQGINTIQTLRQNVAALGKDALKTFSETVEPTYKRLANLLIEQGRLAEAQQVLAMLKEEEYFQYVRRSADTAPKLDTVAGFTVSEEPWQKEYQALSAKAAALGKELGELREKQKKRIITPEEQKRLTVLEEENRVQTVAFNGYLERLIKGLREDARKLTEAEREKRLEEIGEKGLSKTRALQATLKNLGEGSVVLHYLIMDDRLHILLTTPTMQLARQSHIKAAELNKKIFAFRDLLQKPLLDPRPAAEELYTLLIAPVQKELQESSAKTLMLSLDGALRYLPFAALYHDRQYLTQQYRTVMYSEVAKDKIALPTLPTWQVAALGTSAAWPGFNPLDSVPSELKGIVKSDAGGVIPGEIHLDKQFTKDSLQQAAGRNPVLHIASHFKFQPGTDTDSYLLLGDGSHLSLAQVKEGSYFQESELLTLSACETAMGSSAKGSEIEGFGALAMNQGAKSVIATLWPVADSSTAQLMQQFYKLREDNKLPKIEALRQAQLALLNGAVQGSKEDRERTTVRMKAAKTTTTAPPYPADPSKPFAHPYFWAPFVLMGNWK